MQNCTGSVRTSNVRRQRSLPCLMFGFEHFDRRSDGMKWLNVPKRFRAWLRTAISTPVQLGRDNLARLNGAVHA